MVGNFSGVFLINSATALVNSVVFMDDVQLCLVCDESNTSVPVSDLSGRNWQQRGNVLIGSVPG